MVTIYVLKLVNDKYYIGKTSNTSFKLDQNFNNNGCEWTKKYKPIEIVELFSNCNNNDEDKITIQYMGFYGINNVRGGKFSKIILNSSENHVINRMLLEFNDSNSCEQIIDSKSKPYIKHNKYYGDNGIRCSRCHRTGHISTECNADTDINGNIIEQNEPNINDSNVHKKYFQKYASFINGIFSFLGNIMNNIKYKTNN